ncbi:MAG: tetratricopeptide repeat protein [Alphaproteobacteria bacterium]|nr:tetratricopeptide repeat protein [Alphaproteobacteria bacterium]
MTAAQDIRDELAAVGGLEDDAIDIARTALLLAALDRPGVSRDSYHAHLDEIAAAVAARVPAGARHNLARRAGALAAALGGEMGYAGDTLTYEDPQNANLMRVIDRRKGLPVALGILYLHAARAQGWDAAGLNFPGHFLVRLERGPVRVIIDPFNGGREMAAEDMRGVLKTVAGAEAELRPEHYAPTGSRDVLVRLLSNIKLRAAQTDDAARALEIIDRILLIAPGQTALLREAGLFHARLGNLKSAQEALVAFLGRSGDAAMRAEAEKLLQQLRTRLN